MESLKDRMVRTYLRIREAGKGQGYTEYVILLGLIAIVAYEAVDLLGDNVERAMRHVGNSV